ncbi:ABC-F family ATP-binding cassette domain-containing protein [Pseudogemmobacter blasticus]|uniref:ABC transporter n=1 Tax=Fuscovulum blasticum DSM 2131 TaxID=1188250 RepID=A0A2T4J4B2_FUSBL|nr:ABC-F family ATP-binding cassette domain-containing protein [Fuscovulum blasticum]PTE12749.1 ABC transporter [Fuscovulum blasticum DSM 2131]
MPAACITLSNLSWSTPDGRPVLSNLSLTLGPERTGIVGRNGCGKTTLLKLIAGRLRPTAGRLQVAGRIGVLRQDIGAHPGETVADLFGARAGLALLERAATGQAGAEDLAAADWTLPQRIEAALGRCGLELGPQTPLAALSGGQRTRAGLAALILDAPEFLLLDEPTNNLDTPGRQAVADLLRGWRGGAVVVSHDRDLLDAMEAIVELSPLGAARYGGGYSAFAARKAEELEAARHDLAEAGKAEAEARRRAQQAAERKARKDGAGHRARAKGGQPKILLDAAKGRAEASGGANLRLREARLAEAQAALSGARDRIEVVEPLRMEIPATGLPPARLVLRLEAVSGGHDAARPTIRDLSLTLTGPERLAVTGPNGSGKSTLLALIAGQMAPVAGRIDRPVPCALLDQAVGLLDPGQTLRENFLRLSPGAGETACRAALARFRFRAGDALRRVDGLSGGERLRAGLACTLGQPQPPALLLLDEPTNHLDLDATEALEAALDAYDGALIVVSHDERFLRALRLTRRLDLGGRWRG